MPSTTPTTLDGWWCNWSDEYAFLGFSYEITACQSLTQLTREFKDIKNRFNGRYVRLYGFCDKTGYYNNVVQAAWDAGIGVHALIWSGWDGDGKWKTRRTALLGILHSNAKAKFVTRALQFGSEPLYDWEILPDELVPAIEAAQANLSSLGIPVTVSEMAYGYQLHESRGSFDVLDAVDLIDAHILPFFAQDASTANNSWHNVLNDLNWFLDNTDNKKIIFSQNGWPSTTYEGVEPNSPDAVADVQNEKDYYLLLDSKCSFFKTASPVGGVGWFWHIYSEEQEPGYGLYWDDGTTLKFPFAPKISC
ncbi:glycoside hydrolase superfamily [Flagelloscypha sp. PMI_526]|nr:glycoside hydrolase superfamily [Flagelloscypha sp. PMI_526]